MAVSDRIIVMKNAEIAQAGTPHDLYERPASAFIADFIGDANLIDAEIIGSAETKRIRVDGIDHKLVMQTTLTGAVKLVLRPHQIALSATPRTDSIPAEVSYAAYLGNHIQYSLTSNVGEIFAILPPLETPFRRGDNLFVSWRSEDIRLVSQ